ncbi:MAG: relaxase/mobilization nuclease domain-containing protein [Bacillota bacterium]
MATTRLISLHTGKVRTIAAALASSTNYVENPAKTNNGELVTSFACDARTADAEFLLSKRQYLSITGRNQGDRDVIAYHTRQSFNPGEIKPELANKIGYELAMRFTKGHHAFIVATHVDKAHVHTHIIFNSTALDCTCKFRDFLGSARALRRLSDQICLENGLSIIENPKRGGKHYDKWLGDNKPLSYQEKLRLAIDKILYERPSDFDAFLSVMQTMDYEVKQGKYLSFRASGQQKFTRLRSLGDGYSEQEIYAIIEGKKPLSPSRSKAALQEPQGVNLLVDIQAKLQAGKGPGYERWAKVFNLKQMAQTLNFLTENNLLEYAELEEKAAAASKRFNELSMRIKAAETRMVEIGNLKTHIINYAKTRDAYIAYRKAGYSKKFYEAHASDILLHKAAKAVFDTLPGKKIPTIKTLQTEYEKLLSEKKKAYTGYATARKEMKKLLTAKMNIDRLLGAVQEQPERMREQNR